MSESRLPSAQPQVLDERLLAQIADLTDFAFRYACLVLFNQHDYDKGAAEDIAQEAMKRFWKVLAKLHDPQDIKPWLRKVIFNLCRDRGRDRRRSNMHLEKLAYLAARTTSNENTLTDDDQRAIHAAVSQLPSEQQEAVVLYYFGDLTVSEVAELVSAPPGTIKSRLFAARDRLRHLLGAAFPELDLNRDIH